MSRLKIKFISILSIFLLLIQFIMPFKFNNVSSAASTEDVYDVILFWGQSNMVGSCHNGEETRYDPSNSSSVKSYSQLSGIDEDILKNNGTKRNSVSITQQSGTAYEYVYTTNSLAEISATTTKYGENLEFDSTGKLITSSNSSIRALSSSNGTNMIPEFCRTYYQNTGHKVIAVFAALGGKPIRQFLPYDDTDNTVSDAEKSRKLYEAIKEKYTKAIQYLNNNNYRIGTQLYVVFQGEADVERTTANYKKDFKKVHNNLKSLGIQKGAIVETSRAAGTYTMAKVNNVHNAQEQLIQENSDIILGSSFPYDRYVSTESDYSNCNTKVTLDSNGNKLSYNDAIKKARASEDYMDDYSLNNAIHYTSAALSQIGRQSAQNLAASVDHTAPNLSVSYSTTLATNKNVTATITANEQVQAVSGWTLSSDKKILTKTYSANSSEQITVYDIAGNNKKINVVVSNIDKVAPTATVSYNTTSATNKDVTATITANEQIQQVSGWSLSSDKKALTKIYSSNSSEQVTVYDLAGNSVKVNVAVSNIDKIAPVPTVSYSTTLATNKNVTATITANEQIQQISGWSLSSDKKTLTKIYSSNGSEQVTVYDIAGNSAKVNVSVSNIDKTAPIATVSYNPIGITNQDVAVTISANEQIQQVNGWALSADKKTLTKTFTQNGKENLTVYDLAGNPSKTLEIEVANIDKISPIIEVSYTTTEITNQNVTATITSNEPVQNVDGWNISEDRKILTKTFTQNGSEEVTVYDLAGNNSPAIEVSVTNIDKTEPELEVNYSITDITNQDVIATISANEQIQGVESWNISEDGTRLTKIFAQNASEEITIYDIAGNSTTIHVNVNNIDKIAPEVKIEYSTTKLTNADIIATISANEQIQVVDGWNLSEDKKTITKTFTQNTSEDVTIYDIAGNGTTLAVNVVNIDKVLPQININYSTTLTTNQDVTVTITANEQIQQIEGWVLSKSGETLSKVFSQDASENVTISDMAENSIQINVFVSNIDKEAPIADISYNLTGITNQDVVVTITANEQIQEVDGWTLSEDRKTLTKLFIQNCSEELSIYDMAQNSTIVNISVTNIDKDSPIMEIAYSTTKSTNQDVIATITLNEEIQEVESWTLSEDKKVLTKIFTENGKESVTVHDLAGNNSQPVDITVSNIDKIPPEIKASYSTTEITDRYVIVTISADKEIQEVEGWILLEDGKTLTKTFTQNTSEDVTVYDIAGNNTKVKINVSNIDNTQKAFAEDTKNTNSQTAKPTILPKTGIKTVILVVILGLLIIATIFYRKNKNLNI